MNWQIADLLTGSRGLPLRLRLAPATLGYRDLALHRGEFVHGVNARYLPDGFEFLEVALENRSSQPIVIEELGVAIDSLRNLNPPTYPSLEALRLRPALTESYAGGSLEIPAGSSRAFYGDIWTYARSLELREPLRVRGYLRTTSGELRYSDSRKRGYFFLNGSMSFLKKNSSLDLRDRLLRELVPLLGQEADYSASLELCDELISLLRAPLIGSIDSSYARKFAGSRPSRRALIGHFLERIFEDHSTLLAEVEPLELAAILETVALQEKLSAAGSSVQQDYLIPNQLFSERLREHLRRVG